MDLAEFFHLLWRRRIRLLSAFLLVLGVAAGSLAVKTKIYQATATLGLTPNQTRGNDALFLLGQIQVIGPLYAEAVTADGTRRLAMQKLPPGRTLGPVSVRTFADAPLIVKISVRSPDPRLAMVSAQAYVDALVTRAARGEVGFPGLIDILQVDRPSLPTEPISPRPKITMILGGILGLGFGVGLVLLLDNLGRKVETAEMLSELVGAPAFGEIPLERRMTRLSSTSQFLSDGKLRAVAEGIRDLSTNLQFSAGQFRSVLVTSPEGRHGKTSVAFGLAAQLARTGAHTLLVDGDLRRGRMTELFANEVRTPSRAPGLLDVLNGMDPAAAIQPTDLATLSLLASGDLGGDPGQLLESAFFSVLFKLEQMYDLVIIDGTPLLPINDARVMSKFVGATLLVVGSGNASRKQVKEAVGRLRIIGSEPMAVVLNLSRTRRRASYYSYLKSEPAERELGPTGTKTRNRPSI